MGQIPVDEFDTIVKLYREDQLSMREIAEKRGVSIGSVVYFMRKNQIKRRTFSQLNELLFQKKPRTFKLKKLNSNYLKELKIIGSMLYWAEGYKSIKHCLVDFANSDSDMVVIFLNYLRKIYEIDESKLRVLVYCYANQNSAELIKYWSHLTEIPTNQFSKPYVRKDFNENQKRKMAHGLVHIRYSDKKLLLEILKSINHYVKKYAGVWEVDKPSGL